MLTEKYMGEKCAIQAMDVGITFAHSHQNETKKIMNLYELFILKTFVGDGVCVYHFNEIAK